MGPVGPMRPVGPMGQVLCLEKPRYGRSLEITTLLLANGNVLKLYFIQVYYINNKNTYRYVEYMFSALYCMCLLMLQVV